MSKYTIGLDFGTLSGRAVVANVETGKVLGSCAKEYARGVMDRQLPSGEPLPMDWALQDPQDYLDVLGAIIPGALQAAGVDAADVIGIGVDFTSCTLIPVKADGTPLCFLEEYRRKPHAWAKLWKHHGAASQAERLNAAAAGEPWLGNYGHKVSLESAIPKIWQILEEAPELYAAADFIVEAGDWIVWQLCGTLTRNGCAAGYKALWNPQTGYPADAFFEKLDPRLRDVKEKLAGPVVTVSHKAGTVTEAAASRYGLRPGTAVAAATVDAHASVPAAGIDGPGKLMIIMGTSACHMLLGSTGEQVPGISGVVEDGILPGFYSYEAGQSCMGDHFSWFVQTCVPEAYHARAAEEGKNIHAYLQLLAEQQKPGQHGLLALDWWNGNRSILEDSDLTGLLLGMNLQTRPEDIYRALIEATAYGARMIVENYMENGVAVAEVFASGGISRKNSMCMQIYADVLNRPVRVVDCDEASALGSAIYAAVAGGAYTDMQSAVRAMGRVRDGAYLPDPERVAVYDRLFAEYRQLHDLFGRGGNDVMKRLKALKKETR